MKNKIEFNRFLPGYLIATLLIVGAETAAAVFIYWFVDFLVHVVFGSFIIEDKNIVLFYVLALVISIVLYLLIAKLVKSNNNKLVNSLRMDVIDKLIRIPLKEAIIYNTSTVKGLLLKEVDELEKTINKILPVTLINIIVPIVLFSFVTIKLDLSIGLLILITVLVLMVLVLKFKVNSKVAFLLPLTIIYLVIDSKDIVINITTVIFILSSTYHLYDLHKVKDYENINNKFSQLMIKLSLSNSSNGIKNFANADFKLSNLKIENKNLTTYLKRGEKTVFIGKGSEDIIDYLAFFKKYVGTITVRGINFSELSISAYYKHLAILDGDSIVEGDTITDNLRKAKVMIADDEIVEACRKAKLAETIKSLDGQYKSSMDKLNKTQLRMLDIARYFIKDPDIVLVDEKAFFKDIDYQQVYPVYEKFIEGKTAIIVNPLEKSLSENDKLIDLAKI